jgi:hypothetical protein
LTAAGWICTFKQLGWKRLDIAAEEVARRTPFVLCRLPCVNGIPDVVDVLKDADLVTVDGYLGIVTVGLPEFDLELAETR